VDSKTDIRVGSVREAAVFCVLVALGFCVLIGRAIIISRFNVFLIGAVWIVVIATAGALIFFSLDRASRYARSAVGEALLAEGIGRVTGTLRGVVVVATAARVIAIAAHPFRKSTIATVIPYGDVVEFKAGEDSIWISGRAERIALSKCPPSQVAKLAAQLELRISK
jgi:hypothetical protein